MRIKRSKKLILKKGSKIVPKIKYYKLVLKTPQKEALKSVEKYIYTILNYKVGRNILVNRFKYLNNKINYSWLNDSYNTFKVKCKQLLLQ